MMNIKTTLPISEARKRIFELSRNVQRSGMYYTLTEHGVPTTVLLSASYFEALQKKQTLPVPTVREYPSMIREMSTQQYLAAKEAYKEKDLLRAQLLVALTERYDYPFGSIDIGRWIQKGEARSRTFVESDLIVEERDGGALIVCAVEVFQHYEANKPETVRELFDIFSSFEPSAYQGCFIVYATRVPSLAKPSAKQERWLVIDTKKYPTFETWQAAGCPQEKSLPKRPMA